MEEFFSKENLLFFVGSFVSLFSIVNPLLVVPVFVSLTQKYSSQKTANIAYKASINVFGILLVFFVAGGLILNFFGISIEGIRIAGGLMIMGSAIEMLQKKEKLSPGEQVEAEGKDDIAFTPLAMPLLSGPGSIAVIIGMTTDAKTFLQYLIIILVIGVISFVCFIVMRLANFIAQKMGETTMKSFSRIMGFLLLCVGVQYIINGVMPLLKQAFN